jgi:tryptophan-rich sensory protein
MSDWHWGRQIGIDLYIGLLLSVFLIYLHTGSVGIALFWLIPCLIFGNLATLLYFAIHYNSLVEKLLK